jgi:hypothetical protein
MNQVKKNTLPTAMAWDSNGELCSHEFHCLLERLQTQEVNQQNHDQTSGDNKKGGVNTRARKVDKQKRG